MHHKRGRSRNQRAGCKMCKPWKISGVSRTCDVFEKHPDHVARVTADQEIKMETGIEIESIRL